MNPGHGGDSSSLCWVSQAQAGSLHFRAVGWPPGNERRGSVWRAVAETSPFPLASIARVVLRLAGADDTEMPVALSEAERATIAASKAAAAKGDFATEDEVNAVWDEYGP